jgi:hypothetical protein
MDVRRFSAPTCNGNIERVSTKIVVKGTISDNVVDGRIRYVASAPIDRRSSFTGSGLPFANAQQAFDNTPNKGNIELRSNNTFEIKINEIPNSYYAGLGTVLVPPSVFIMYHDGNEIKKMCIQIAEPIPYRMLTYPMSNTFARKDAQFYAGGFELPVRTQEQILLDSCYDVHVPMKENFWGLRPRQ